MNNSVCHNCPRRLVPKTCENTCVERQQELRMLEARRQQRYLDNMEGTNKRIADYRHKMHKQIKQGRKG
jgi:hypothetical protein